MRKIATAVLPILMSTNCLATQSVPDVIITTDCGSDIDDQWAIMHMALSPRIRTLGVIGEFAPNAHETVACANEVIKLAGKSVPVVQGATAPIPEASHAVDFIVGASRTHSPSDRLIIAILGPATSVAQAVLSDPTLASRIEVAALAFDDYPAGSDGWNVANDIKAWQILLDAQIPVVAASGSVARDGLMLQKNEAPKMMAGLGRRGKFLAVIHKRWLEVNGASFPETQGGRQWPIWDEAVTAIVLDMVEKETRPRPSMKDDMTFNFPNPTSDAKFSWVKKINRRALFANLQATLRASYVPPKLK